MSAIVCALSADSEHRFSKAGAASLTIIAGLGVAGDAHSGITVKHRSRVARDPSQPNLRQVHLIHRELLDELAGQGFDVQPGQLGENITTAGIDLLALPVDTELRLGSGVVLRVTGLRNPCAQIERFRPGLLAAVLGRAPDGALIRKAGIMTVAVAGGVVRAGDPIVAVPPAGVPRPLAPV
ncbi:MAG: MOSC domain-containing protein [Lautropia sp.]